MATPTYTLIDSTTLTSSASSVTFSSITQDYRDLVLVTDTVVNTQAPNFKAKFNNDSGANYNWVFMRGDQYGAASFAFSNRNDFDSEVGLQEVENCSLIFQIMDYSATDKHKSMLVRGNQNSYPQIFSHALRYASTSAITTIELFPSSSTFKAPSTFYLFGIEA